MTPELRLYSLATAFLQHLNSLSTLQVHMCGASSQQSTDKQPSTEKCPSWKLWTLPSLPILAFTKPEERDPMPLAPGPACSWRRGIVDHHAQKQSFQLLLLQLIPSWTLNLLPNPQLSFVGGQWCVRSPRWSPQGLDSSPSRQTDQGSHEIAPVQGLAR